MSQKNNKHFPLKRFYKEKANSPAFLTIKMQDIDSDVIVHSLLKLTQLRRERVLKVAFSRRMPTGGVIKENNVIYAKVKED